MELNKSVDLCVEVPELFFLADARGGSDTHQPAKGLCCKCLSVCLGGSWKAVIWVCFCLLFSAADTQHTEEVSQRVSLPHCWTADPF